MKKVEEDFLEYLVRKCLYWANMPLDTLEPDEDETEAEARINGFIHSLLVLLNGDSGFNGFVPYELKIDGNILGENTYLPREYFNVFSKIKEEKNNKELDKF